MREFNAIEQRRVEAENHVVALKNAPYNTHDWKQKCMWQATAIFYARCTSEFAKNHMRA